MKKVLVLILIIGLFIRCSKEEENINSTLQMTDTIFIDSVTIDTIYLVKDTIKIDSIIMDSIIPEFDASFKDYTEEELEYFIIQKDFIKCDWDSISKNCTLSEEFIKKYATNVNWNLISKYQVLSDFFIKVFINKLDYYELITSKNLSDNICELLCTETYKKPGWLNTYRFCINLILKYQDISVEFFESIYDKISNHCNLDWGVVSYELPINIDFFTKYVDKISWLVVSQRTDLTIDFLNTFSDKLDWWYISQNTLSEDVIREFENMVKWDAISWFQVLSEDFIREFKDKVNWIYIFRYQEYSEEFKEEFKYKLD